MEIAAAISPLQIILQPITTVVAKVATPAPPIHQDQTMPMKVKTAELPT
ncbi:MAG: hypothetical protein WAM26_15405 [Nitrososphaeraceae archaeon]